MSTKPPGHLTARPGYTPRMDAIPSLVVSTGDLSDVDGFLALAAYALIGVDVMFIMNYPAYIGSTVEPPTKLATGRGYAYGARAVLQQTEAAHANHPCFPAYMALLDRYDQPATNERMKSVLTDLAFHMASRVWKESRQFPHQKLYFCIGGINDVNPFSHTAVKNEALVYADACQGMACRIQPAEQGVVFNEHGIALTPTLQALVGAYRDVYVDFNGSMAFIDPQWVRILQGRNIRAALVMGGVLADEPPKTKPSIPGVLNRLSCSTLNQLYSPAKTRRFFAAMKGVPVYVVCNNAVHEFEATIPEFLDANHIDAPGLRLYCEAYYIHNPYSGQKKPFDLYVAKVAQSLICKTISEQRTRTFFHDGTYGISLIGIGDWHAAVAEYYRQCNAEPSLVRFRSALAAELAVINSVRDIHATDVMLVDFEPGNAITVRAALWDI